MGPTAHDLVAEHWDRLFRVSYLVCRSEAEAEDLTQETLRKAIESLDSFDAGRPIDPWLNRIASNTARDWLRRQRRIEFIPLDDDPSDEAEDVADQLAARCLPDQLSAALDRLDPLSRLVIVLRHVLDLNATEIAASLGTQPATVRTRLRRGLLQLREELEPEEVADADQAR